MDLKNKKDEELVSDAWNTISSRTNSIEMMRRLKNSIEKLDKTTDKYSRILIILTIILVIVSFTQIIVTIFTGYSNPWTALIVEVMVLMAIFYLAKKLTKDFIN